MSAPEDISSVSSNTFIEWVSAFGLTEWWVLGDHDEEDHGCGEEVNLLSLVGCLDVDLWGHIIESAKFCVKISLTISSFQRSSESKVSNLKGVILIQK